jgi:hypothetical protein
MYRIICKIKGAPLRINGLDFVPHRDGIVTADAVDNGVADYFRKVTGYHVVDVDAFEVEGDADTVGADPAVERPKGKPGRPSNAEKARREAERTAGKPAE